MKISPGTRQLLNQLSQPGLWSKLKGSDHEADLLSEAGKSEEPAAIIDIMPYALAGSAEVAAAAVAAVHKLISQAQPTDLQWLDRAWRERVQPTP